MLIYSHLVGSCMYESLVIGRSVMVYNVRFHLQNIFLQILPIYQGELGQHSRAEISACTQGEHNPFPLMSKGENDFESLGVAIKSKGGDCWHYDRGLALWHRCCP